MELNLEKKPQCLRRSRKSVTVWLLTATAVEHDVEVEESKRGDVENSDADHLGTAVHTV